MSTKENTSTPDSAAIPSYKHKPEQCFLWIDYTLGYLMAAEVLCESVLGKPDTQRKQILYAIAFNYRHSLELLVKTIIYASSREGDGQKLNTHDFDKFTDRAIRLFDEVSDSRLTPVCEIADAKPADARKMLKAQIVRISKLAKEVQSWGLIGLYSTQVNDQKNAMMRYPSITPGSTDSLLDPYPYFSNLDFNRLATNISELMNFTFLFLGVFTDFATKPT